MDIIQIRDISITFKLVWGNLYIRKLIQYHLKLFNIYYAKRFVSIKELLDSQFGSYYRDIEFSEYKKDKPLDLVLPKSIESIEYCGKHQLLIPDWIKQVVSCENNVVFGNSSSLETLAIEFYENVELTSCPPSVTNLTLKYASGELDHNALPAGLKILYIVDSDIITIKEFPQSLNQLFISNSRDIAMELDRLPTTLTKLMLDQVKKDSIKDLSYLVSLSYLSIRVDELDFKLPINLKQLSIDTQKINDNILPSNLEQLTISSFSGGQLKINSLPANLKKLECRVQSNNIVSILPKSIDHLKLVFNDFELKPNILPPNLKWLSLSEFNNNGKRFDVGKGKAKNSRGSSLFPSTITSLEIGEKFDQSIPVNLLPPNLTSLVLGRSFNQEIIEDSIPDSCTSLSLLNTNYTHYPIKLKNPNHTILQSYHNYRHYQHHLDCEIIKIPHGFNEPISRLQLNNKFNLKVLDLDNWWFNKEINSQDLPNNNKIQMVKVGDGFNKSIDLNLFNNLQVIELSNESNPKIIIGDNNNTYKLNKIIVPFNNTQFLDNIDPILYSFIKLKRTSNS